MVDLRLVEDWYGNYQAELGFTQDTATRSDLINLFIGKVELALTWLEAQCLNANITVTGDILLGRVSECLCQETIGASILAVGRRGNSHTTDAHSLGSNFRDLINQVHIPILVGGEEERSLKHLLLIIHGSQGIIRSLAWVTRYKKIMNSQVIVLAIQRNNYDLQMGFTKIMTELKKNGLDDYHLVNHSVRSFADITAAIRETQAAFLIMVKEQHPAVIKWLARSSIDRLLLSMSLTILLI